MNKKLFIIVGTIVVALVFPMYFLLSSATTSTNVVESSVPTSEAEAEFITLAAQLQNLNFDTSILSDARFLALVDLHTAILPEVKGKRDPFGPIGR